MRRTIFIGGGILLVGVFVLLGIQREAAAPVTQTVADEASRNTPQNVSTLFVGDAAIFVELALTDDERMRGLGGREIFPQNAGMLFMFSNAAPHGIWMKNMRFPIDIIWLSTSETEGCAPDSWEETVCLVVIDIKEQATPESYPEVFYPRAKALYVLELNAGVARSYGIRPGAVVALKGP